MERAGNAVERLKDLAGKAAQTMIQTFSDVFFDGMTTGFKNLEDIGKNALRALERAVADFLVAEHWKVRDSEQLTARLDGSQLPRPVEVG
jgi:hypothetical protein